MKTACVGMTNAIVRKKMKELKATRVPPGDRWVIVDDDKEKIYSSLTEVLNAIFVQTGIAEFYMDAKQGEVHIEDGKVKPEPVKKYSLYGEELQLYLLYSIILLVIANIIAFYQLNGQFIWKDTPFWNNGALMSIVGIPVGYMFFWATKFSYEHFGFLWNMRMIGFGVGTIIFGIMSYAILKEVPTLKTFICILLAVAIILIQVTNVIDE